MLSNPLVWWDQVICLRSVTPWRAGVGYGGGRTHPHEQGRRRRYIYIEERERERERESLGDGSVCVCVKRRVTISSTSSHMILASEAVTELTCPPLARLCVSISVVHNLIQTRKGRLSQKTGSDRRGRK